VTRQELNMADMDYKLLKISPNYEVITFQLNLAYLQATHIRKSINTIKLSYIAKITKEL